MQKKGTVRGRRLITTDTIELTLINDPMNHLSYVALESLLLSSDSVYYELVICRKESPIHYRESVYYKLVICRRSLLHSSESVDSKLVVAL